jgi:acid phosphatase (class A)
MQRATAGRTEDPRMIRPLVVAAALLGLLFGCVAQTPKAQQRQPAAAPAEVKLWYLDQPAVDALVARVPAPPPDGGLVSRGEGDLMLALRAEASPAARERAHSEADLRLASVAEVLGTDLNPQAMPRTMALLRRIEHDSAVVTDIAKRTWARARPPAQDDRLTPLFGVPKSASYPSGHAVRAIMWARVLGMLDPAKQDDLLRRARLVALGRVIAGVHYPTDVAAGMSLGNLIADDLAATPAFQADLAAARAEWPASPR